MVKCVPVGGYFVVEFHIDHFDDAETNGAPLVGGYSSALDCPMHWAYNKDLLREGAQDECAWHCGQLQTVVYSVDGERPNIRNKNNGSAVMGTAIADSEKGVMVLNEIERAREPKLKYNTGLAALQIGKNKDGDYNIEMHLAFV